MAYQQEDSLRNFVAYSPASVAMFDREMRYLAASARWMSDHRLAGDLIGRHYEASPEVTPAWRAIHQRGLAGETVMAQTPFQGPDGRVHQLQWVVWPWATSATDIGGIIIFSAETGSPAPLTELRPAPALAADRPRDFSLELCRTNDMLNLLPDRLLEVIGRELTPVAIRRGEILIDALTPLRAILFPLEGLYSVMRTLADGSTFEVAATGRTCGGGIAFLFGDTALEADTIALLNGSALAIKPARLRALCDQHAEFRSWLDVLAEATGLEVQRSEGCNARHTLQQRLARWLLHACDEARREELAISQDTLAGLLAVRRAGVNEVLADLRERGHVNTGRSRIAITDRTGLKTMACECYQEDVVARARFFAQPAGR